LEELFPDRQFMLKLARTKMPYGKFVGKLLIDLPEPYIVWMRQQGFPEGELGAMLQCIYEVKLNGLEYLFDPLRPRR
jgi:uncharacterized protein